MITNISYPNFSNYQTKNRNQLAFKAKFIKNASYNRCMELLEQYETKVAGVELNQNKTTRDLIEKFKNALEKFRKDEKIKQIEVVNNHDLEFPCVYIQDEKGNRLLKLVTNVKDRTTGFRDKTHETDRTMRILADAARVNKSSNHSTLMAIHDALDKIGSIPQKSDFIPEFNVKNSKLNKK